jgi:phosphohistidine phosphatase
MRHGDAPYINGERQISDVGHEQIKKMARWYASHLKDHSLRLEQLLVSPVLRAQQTANTFEDAFAKLVDYSWVRETEPLLKSEANPEMTIPFVDEVTSGTILLISHMPLVSHLWAGWLKGQSQYFPTAAIGCFILGDSGAEKMAFQSPE